jgi:hypothetical protein
MNKKLSGRGAFLASDARSIYEGFFLKGKKNGPGRIIRLFGSNVMTVRTENYKLGMPVGKFLRR